jgi:hypothetical protein
MRANRGGGRKEPRVLFINFFPMRNSERKKLFIDLESFLDDCQLRKLGSSRSDTSYDQLGTRLSSPPETLLNFPYLLRILASFFSASFSSSPLHFGLNYDLLSNCLQSSPGVIIKLRCLQSFRNFIFLASFSFFSSIFQSASKLNDSDKASRSGILAPN